MMMRGERLKRRTNMAERRGEKAGWTIGFLGGFAWVAVLSVVFLLKGKPSAGAIGLLLFSAAIVAVLYFAPWRHPRTSAWKLMLVPYFFLALSFAWGAWAYGGLAPLGLEWWNIVWFVPLLLPFFTGGNRKWSDGGNG